MRIALFGTTELNTFPELQDIARRHTVIPFLADRDDLRGWQNDLRQSPYDILHFAGHIIPDDHQRPTRLILGPHELTMDDVVSMAKLSGSRFLFFNACESAMFANYAVRNGIPASIYTTAPLPDDEAWKYPLMFYEQVARMEEERAIVDLRKSFEASVDRTGFYGWVSNGIYERDLLSPIVDEIGRLYTQAAQHKTESAGRNLHYQAQLDIMVERVRWLTLAGGGGLLANLLMSAVALLRGWV